MAIMTIDPTTTAAGGDGVEDRSVQLRTIPLSRIVVADGFNARGEMSDDRELDERAETMRRYGCIQPVRVYANEIGDYVLIAGERRYRAAVKAALTEVPAIIRPVGVGDGQEQADLLVEALIENDQRQDLDPLARARGYQRLIASGLTVRGVAERIVGLDAPRSTRERVRVRVRDHLRILKLPEGLQRKVADAEVPMRAVKALAGLEAIHSGLAALAAERVLNPGDDYKPYAWADLDRAPVEIVLSADELPDGVYRTYASYPIESFELPETAQRDLAALERLTGRSLDRVQLRDLEIEQARALRAAYGESWQTIIVGTDVVTQLVGDYIAGLLRCVRKVAREQRKRERALEQRQAAMRADATNPGETVGGADAAQEVEPEPDPEQARLAQRGAERKEREQATSVNLELGRGVYTTLSRVRVDETVLKLLASVNVCGDLSELVARGARYGFPGWVTETIQKNGKPTYTYLDGGDGHRRGSDYLAAGEKSGDVAGRQVALVAMAVYADQYAVAFSNRSFHHVTPKGPWAGEFDALLDQLVKEMLPAATLAVLGRCSSAARSNANDLPRSRRKPPRQRSGWKGSKTESTISPASSSTKQSTTSAPRGQAGRRVSIS